jgi:hypothetical protein
MSDDKYKQAIENHRLISKIDNNGNMNGSILLFNHKQSIYGIRKVIGDNHNEKEDSLLNSFIFITK